MLTGKKTYIVAALFLIAMLAPVLFGFTPPEWVWGVLSAAGLAAVRMAIQELNGVHGWKTYAASAAVFVIAMLNASGVAIPPEVLDGVYAVFGALGIVGVRNAVEKLKT